MVRGKTGRVYGDLMALLTVLKGLPLAYNKDLQEDKEALFDAVDTVKKCLLVFAPLLKTTKFKAERMREGAGRGFTNATDLADYLVRRGLPFRSAHEVVGRLVLYCTRNHKTLEELSLAELNRESGLAGGPDNEAGGEPAAKTNGLGQISGQAGGQNAENGWFEPGVYAAIRLETCVAARRIPGGPAPDQLRSAITRARDKLQKLTAF